MLAIGGVLRAAGRHREGVGLEAAVGPLVSSER